MNINYCQQYQALKQELETDIEALLRNKKFNKYDSITKKQWYKIHLVERIIKKKYQQKIFNILIGVYDELIPITFEENISKFANIDNIKCGDKMQ